jgi:prepilin-type processing-associated H-X9-DG protein
VNVLSNRHYLNDDNLDPTHGMGNAGFCDGHVERVMRTDAVLPSFCDPTIH